MIERSLEQVARDIAGRFPVLTVTGPRQSGKTTLCSMAFPEKPLISLESPDVRRFALSDPRGFLGVYIDGAVLDEVQRAPDLLSYLQTMVDEDRTPGRFVLTGSQNFALLSSISQSLAGRTAVLNLLPFTLAELRRMPSHEEDLFPILWAGGYPAIHDRGVPADEWLANYVLLYVERDVRQVLNVGDLVAFETFLRLCAGRAGQLVNLSALAADCGVTHGTAKSWLSVLETGYIAFRLPPFLANIRKRLVKTPKLFFHDTGLLCHLLGIERSDQLVTHPMRGAVFENWVISEIYKNIVNQGKRATLAFYRDRKGLEVDLIIERGDTLMAVEAKSGQTVASDFTSGLDAFARAMADDKRYPTVQRTVIYGGDRKEPRRNALILPWRTIHEQAW